MSIVLITGSGRRIGRGLGIEFAKKGWDVVVNYNLSENEAMQTVEDIRGFGVRSIAFKADIRSKQEIDKMFETCQKEFGVPDVLVNNAGIFPEAKPLQELTEEFWDNALNVNLRGEFFAAQTFAKYAQKGARIINISSLGALEVWKNRIPYNVSKSGIIQLTKALARELAPDISVNTVCPGAIFNEEEPSKVDTTLIDIKKIPMKRFGSIKDVFDAVYFFATCSNYITAQLLTIDGGYHDAR